MPGAGGKNISVPVSWKNVPAGAKSFALSIVDPHPVAQNWVHWLVINIPKEVTVIEEGASRKGCPWVRWNSKIPLETLGMEVLSPQKEQGIIPML